MTYGQLAYGEWIAARSSTGLNTPAWEDIMEDERYQWERVGALVGKCGESGGIAPDGQMVVGSIAFAPKVPWWAAHTETPSRSVRFQSDKYPSCPPGKVPLSVKDTTAQDLLWEYAQRRRVMDAEFSADLMAALNAAGYRHAPSQCLRHIVPCVSDEAHAEMLRIQTARTKAVTAPTWGEERVNGTCCTCGYAGEEETPCLRREDGVHCEHWCDGPGVDEGGDLTPKRTSAPEGE